MIALFDLRCKNIQIKNFPNLFLYAFIEIIEKFVEFSGKEFSDRKCVLVGTLIRLFFDFSGNILSVKGNRQKFL